jgi:hypothetical protein
LCEQESCCTNGNNFRHLSALLNTAACEHVAGHRKKEELLIMVIMGANPFHYKLCGSGKNPSTSSFFNV